MKPFLFFLAVLFSVLTFSQTVADCETPLVLCSTTDLNIAADGIGRNEFNDPDNVIPPCYTFDAHHIWVEVNIESTGLFEFSLIPEISGADFDFAIYGPDVACDSLGVSIRCSSTNPARAGVTDRTGLNTTETDVAEGPGPDGNGFLKAIDAVVGEVYYIVIDRAVGSGGFVLEPGGTAQLPATPSVTGTSNQEICDDDGVNDGSYDFNINQFDTEFINGQNFVTISYHSNESDAGNNINPLNGTVTATGTQTFYVRYQNVNSECVAFSEFDVEVVMPREPIDIGEVSICDLPNNNETVDLTEVATEELGDLSGLNITYHNDLAEAQSQTNDINSVQDLGPGSEVFFIAYRPAGESCVALLLVTVTLVQEPEVADPSTINVCDDDYNQRLNLFLPDLDSEILGPDLDPANYDVSYFRRMVDRSNSRGQLADDYEIIESPFTLFATVTDTRSGCTNETELTIVIDDIPLLPEIEDIFLCLDREDNALLTMPAGFADYEWSTGEQGPDENEIEVSSGGTYSVIVTGDNGCTQTSEITVVESEAPTITDIRIDQFRNNDNSITVVVAGIGNYSYRLDQGVYQSSNTFTGLRDGIYTVQVNDDNGCGSVSQEVTVLEYPRFFTPNNDGFNDFWQIPGMDAFPDLRVSIYDRHGKFIKQFGSQSLGWDGTYNGYLMPSSDYWFVVTLTDHPDIRGHFSLKR